MYVKWLISKSHVKIMSYNLYTYNEPHSAHMTYTIQILLLKIFFYKFGDCKNSQPTLHWFIYIYIYIIDDFITYLLGDPIPQEAWYIYIYMDKK